MRGKIIRGVGGFYYVHAEDDKVYECRAKGIFRKENIKPLVGDDVEISVLDPKEKSGSVDALLPRRNLLTRPEVANVDQTLVVFSLAEPNPNPGLLDRYLILMDRQDIPVVICFNKADLAVPGQTENLKSVYAGCGSPLIFVSVKNDEGVDRIREILRDKTTVLAGPSGVGKSSLTNTLLCEKHMEVGEVSRKIGRGKNTTRHTEFIVFEENSYLLDTPGFSSLELGDVSYEELKDSFHEFDRYAADCRFSGCMHLKEPGCAVKQAVKEEKIHPDRYESYRKLALELHERKKY